MINIIYRLCIMYIFVEVKIRELFDYIVILGWYTVVWLFFFYSNMVVCSFQDKERNYLDNKKIVINNIIYDF